MDKKEQTSIAFFGGFPIALGKDGIFTVQQFFVDFLMAFRKDYDRVIVFGLVSPNTKVFSGRLDASELEIVPLPSGMRNRLSAWKKVWDSLPVDVFWGHMPNMLVLYPFMPILRLRIKKIIIYNGNDIKQYVAESKYGKNSLFHNYGLWAYRDNLKKADAIIARGKKLCQEAESLNSKVIETIPMTNLDFWDYGPLDYSSEKSVIEIIFAGQMLWTKGLRELLDAFENLTKAYQGKSFQLNLLGDGENMEEIRNFSKSLSCSEKIVFYGWVDCFEVLDSIWSQAMLVVMPTSIYPEGVPRIIEEGLCRRFPVVATKVGGVQEEFLNGEVLLVEPGSSGELEAGMKCALFDEEVRSRLRIALEKRAAYFRRYHSAAHQHLEVIRES